MYPYLNEIEFPRLKDLGETKPIGLDHGDLLLHREFRVGRSGEPMTVKSKLGWVVTGGSKRNKSESSSNFLCNNSSVLLTKTFKTLEG